MANSNNETVLQLELPGIKKLKSGKVREVFDLGDRLLFVASDRISAFDVIMPNGIPRKGEVLTQISYFWFAQTATFQPNHLLSRARTSRCRKICQPFADKLARRSMIVKKAKPLAIECVVRGYLAGSGWKEYQKSQTVCGIKLPPGLKESPNCPSRFSRRPPRPRPATTKTFRSRRRQKIAGRGTRRSRRARRA